MVHEFHINIPALVHSDLPGRVVFCFFRNYTHFGAVTCTRMLKRCTDRPPYTTETLLSAGFRKRFSSVRAARRRLLRFGFYCRENSEKWPNNDVKMLKNTEK